jgi:NifU-like protein involved in Fe-S cluster formation
VYFCVSSWIVLSQLRTLILYTDAFKDHIANPRNAGELADANATAEATNPVCGDRMRLSLRIEGGRIELAGFLAYGCPPTLVCGSALTGLIIGKTVAEAMLLERTDLVAAIGGLPSRKQHAAALAIETLRSAIENEGSGGKPPS